MKINFKSKYFLISVYAFFTLVAFSLFSALLNILPSIFGWIGTFFSIISPVIYGLVIAFLLNPLLRVLENLLRKLICRSRPRPKLLRGVALGITYLIFFLALVLLVSMVVPQLVKSISELASNAQGYYDAVSGYVSKILEDLNLSHDQLQQIDTYWKNLINTGVNWLTSDLIPELSNQVFSIITGLTNLLFGLFISLYVLASKERFAAQARKLTYSIFRRGFAKKLIDLTSHTSSVFTSFLSGKVLDSAIVGMITFVAMSIFGLPYAPLISVIIAVSNMIPLFGPFIGAIPSALLILIVDFWQAILFVVIIVVIQQIDGNILGPKILGESTGLSAFWVMCAILLGGGFFGVVGMIIGVPAFAVIYSLICTLVEHILAKRGLPVETSAYF